MQTESIFRAARVLAAVSGTIRDAASDVGFQFKGRDNELIVLAWGRPVDRDGTVNLMDAMDNINAVASNLSPDDAFKLVFVDGHDVGDTGAVVWRVEAA